MRSRALSTSVVVALVACGGAGSLPLASSEAPRDAGASSAADASPPGVVTRAGAISASSAWSYEAETQVAVGAGGALGAAFIASDLAGGRRIAFARSSDDGATWSAPSAIDAPGGRSGVDPCVVSGDAGGFVVSFLGAVYDASGAATDRRVYVARAADGATFAAPVEVSDGAPVAYDKPWTTRLADGALLVVYSTDDGSTVYAARSDDGATWTRATIAPDATLRGPSYACHPSTGARAYVAYLVPGGVRLARSDDGGRTWPDATAAVAVNAPGEAAAFDPPSCAAEGDDVWVAYGDLATAGDVDRADTSSAIVVARSRDGGATFDRTPVPDRGPLFLHPHLAREPSGALDVVFYAGDTADATQGGVRYARSLDGGATWAPTGAIQAPIDFVTERTGLGWLGDYLGVATAPSALYVTYADNVPASGAELSHVAFARVAY